MAKIRRKGLDGSSLQEKQTNTFGDPSLLRLHRRSGEAAKLNGQLEATKVVPPLLSSFHCVIFLTIFSWGF